MSANFKTDMTDLPTCPYCGAEDNDWWEYSDRISDGCEIQVSCDYCEADYKLIPSISFSFSFSTYKTKEV